MSIEQMSGMPPQQPDEEPKKPENEKLPDGGEQKPERETTSPEEAAEMTRQRRLEFGLEVDPKELLPEEIEALRQKIDDNLGILYSYNPESFSSEIQEQIYFVGMEAEAGKDIELAAKQLELFLVTLWRSKEFKNLGVVPESEGKKERVLSREEILSQLGNRCEISKIEQELADEEGIYLLEVINKENTKRYSYQRKRYLPGQPRRIESGGTIIRSEDLDDGFSKIIADYNLEMDKWIDQ